MKNLTLRIILILGIVIMPIATFGYGLAKQERIDRLCGTTEDAKVIMALGLGLTWPLYVSYRIFDTSTEKDKCL